MIECNYDKFKRLVKEAESDLTYPHDGPVTKFVMIGRAIDLVRAGKYDMKGHDLASLGEVDVITEALDSVLEGELER